jgi:hypothetical protein
MDAICRQYGIGYFHFLQPNQYYAGSKVLTEEERKIAYEEGPYGYRMMAQNGYPLLVARGRSLVDKGVNFFDLTQIFRQESRTVYNDKCCHFNRLGYNTIARRIAKAIIRVDGS